jgi:hypothetical protein
LLLLPLAVGLHVRAIHPDRRESPPLAADRAVLPQLVDTMVQETPTWVQETLTCEFTAFLGATR